MRMMVDLTEQLSEWTNFLSDMQCDIEDLESIIMYYNPMYDSLFLDELAECETTFITDDVIELVSKTSDTMLRNKLDYFMGSMGYEIGRIVKVFITNLKGTILAILDVIPLNRETGCLDDSLSGLERTVA